MANVTVPAATLRRIADKFGANSALYRIFTMMSVGESTAAQPTSFNFREMAAGIPTPYSNVPGTVILNNVSIPTRIGDRIHLEAFVNALPGGVVPAVHRFEIFCVESNTIVALADVTATSVAEFVSVSPGYVFPGLIDGTMNFQLRAQTLTVGATGTFGIVNSYASLRIKNEGQIAP